MSIPRVSSVPWPRWIDPTSGVNLREVATNLYIGGSDAVGRPPSGAGWSLVVDVDGSAFCRDRRMRYIDVPVVLSFGFDDGDPVPRGLLDIVLPLVYLRLDEGPVLVHCAAGMSRSASVVYALLRRLHDLDHSEAMRRVFVTNPWPLPNTLYSARMWVHRSTS